MKPQLNVSAIPGYTPYEKVDVKHTYKHCNFNLNLHDTAGTIYPTHQVDYKLGGCQLSWLNTDTVDEAINYYRTNFPFLPDQALIGVARADFNRKVEYLTSIE
jgi:hypothetical protein